MRLLEGLGTAGLPADPAARLRGTVRTEARRAGRAARRERPYAAEPVDDIRPGPDHLALHAARRGALHSAVRRVRGRCPCPPAALLSPGDRTYREIAGELGISQGSLGPERSRCLGCLRRMLTAEVAACEPRG